MQSAHHLKQGADPVYVGLDVELRYPTPARCSQGHVTFCQVAKQTLSISPWTLLHADGQARILLECPGLAARRSTCLICIRRRPSSRAFIIACAASL